MNGLIADKFSIHGKKLTNILPKQAKVPVIFSCHSPEVPSGDLLINSMGVSFFQPTIVQKLPNLHLFSGWPGLLGFFSCQMIKTGLQKQTKQGFWVQSVCWQSSWVPPRPPRDSTGDHCERSRRYFAPARLSFTAWYSFISCGSEGQKWTDMIREKQCCLTKLRQHLCCGVSRGISLADFFCFQHLDWTQKRVD